MKQLTLKYFVIFLIGAFLEWGLVSMGLLPKYIGKFNIDGMLITLLLIIFFVALQKAMIKLDPFESVLRLTLHGLAIFTVGEIIVQTIRISFMPKYTFSDSVNLFLHSTSAPTLFAFALSFFVAYHLKTKKTGNLIVFILLFLALIYVTKVMHMF